MSYELREEQLDMMRAVSDGFNRRTIVVVEAGTGVGKSLAYLLPAFHWAAANEERIVISTATINLQQQLIEKDIPLVRRISGLDVRAVLVKGRGNYLCLRRLEEAVLDPDLFETANAEVALLREWAESSPTGSRSELPFGVSEEAWLRVCSESDGCRAMRCLHRGECFVLKARKEAASARILVVNHHLLFADLAIRASGVGKDGTAVLPPFRHIIFDEAHNIEKSATSYFADRFARVPVQRNLALLHRGGGSRSGLLHRVESFFPPGESAIDAIVDLIEQARVRLEEADFDLSARVPDRTYRFRAGGGWIPLGTVRERFAELQALLIMITTRTASLLRSVPEARRDADELFDMEVVIRRIDQYAAILSRALHFEESPDFVFWVEKRTNRRGESASVLHGTPLEIRDIMRRTVYENYDTVICTSATLTVRGGFTYFADRIGIADVIDKPVEYLKLDSPFAYFERVLLSVPTDAPQPTDAGYPAFVERMVGDVLELSEGRGLVLFTSYRMLDSTWDVVAPRLAGLGITALRQDGEDRARLLERFSSDETSVLFATDSFWEGVDTPGDALRVVMICRLPFRVPNDPVMEAKVEALERAGRNAFYELSVPQAVMKLKQGFGRLMRRSSDRGVVVVLDPRIVKSRYGELFIESLPATMRSFSGRDTLLADVERFLYS